MFGRLFGKDKEKQRSSAYEPLSASVSEAIYTTIGAGSISTMPGAAQKAFEQIGDNWDKDSWGSKRYFDLSKAWASDAAVTNKWLDEIISSVEKNMQSPEGHEYDSQIASEFQEQFATTVKQCVDAADTDPPILTSSCKSGRGDLCSKC